MMIAASDPMIDLWLAWDLRILKAAKKWYNNDLMEERWHRELPRECTESSYWRLTPAAQGLLTRHNLIPDEQDTSVLYWADDAERPRAMRLKYDGMRTIAKIMRDKRDRLLSDNDRRMHKTSTTTGSTLL